MIHYHLTKCWISWFGFATLTIVGVLNAQPIPHQEDRDATIDVAIKMINSVPLDTGDRSLWVAPMRGMDLLADQYFMDPRAEAILAGISRPPQMIPGLGVTNTLETEAWDRLQRLRANKMYVGWMNGLNAADERLKKTHKLVELHAGILDKPPADMEGYVTAIALRVAIRRSLDDSGADAVNLALKFPRDVNDKYIGHHGESLIKALSKTDRSQIFRHDHIVAALSEADAKGLADLLLQWLRDASDDKEIQWLVRSIGTTPDGRGRLLAMLEDRRGAVVAYASRELSRTPVDQPSYDAVAKASVRLRDLDVDQKYRSITHVALNKIAVGLRSEQGRESILKDIDVAHFNTRFKLAVMHLIDTYPDQVTLDRLREISQTAATNGRLDDVVSFIDRMINDRLIPRLNRKP